MPKHAIPPRREILPPERREEFVLRSPTAKHLIPPVVHASADQRQRTGMEQQRPPRPNPTGIPIQNPELCTRRTTPVTHPGACRTARSWRVRPECARHGGTRGKEASRRAEEPAPAPRGADLAAGGKGRKRGDREGAGLTSPPNTPSQMPSVFLYP